MGELQQNTDEIALTDGEGQSRMRIPAHRPRGYPTMKSTLMAGAALWLAGSAFAASYVVPTDRALVARSNAIVIASAIDSYAVDDPRQGIETITHFSVQEAIKGGALVGSAFELREPGGQFGKRVEIVFGAPRFALGEPVLLFLYRAADGSLTTTDFGLGHFAFATDENGHRVLMRAEGDISGWDIDGTPHQERRRDAARFLDFLRAGLQALFRAEPDYYLPTRPLLTRSTSLRTAPTFAPLGPTSYTFARDIETSAGFRWNNFPSAVSWNQGNTLPSAPGGGTTAILAAFGAWNSVSGTNINYQLASFIPNLKGIGDGPDSTNNIVFERALGTPYSCTDGGLIGIGFVEEGVIGFDFNRVAGEGFISLVEADVSMNAGLDACGSADPLFTSGDFNTALTHELGHTLGFRDADKDRLINQPPPCTTDMNLDCSDSAIMTASTVPGLAGALQEWDINAARALYPGEHGIVPAAPGGVIAHVVSSKEVRVTWVPVSGAVSYEVYRRDAGTTRFTLLGTTRTNTFSDIEAPANAAYLYRVRAVNDIGSSADSLADLATLVTFTDDPLVARSTHPRAVHLAEVRMAVNAVRALARMPAATFTDAATPGVVIKAVHIAELRAALDAALLPLGFLTGGYTDAVAPGVLARAIHIQELRNRMK
jgi:hypothetical protein